MYFIAIRFQSYSSGGSNENRRRSDLSIFIHIGPPLWKVRHAYPRVTLPWQHRCTDSHLNTPSVGSNISSNSMLEMDKSGVSKIFILWSPKPGTYSSLETQLVECGWQIKHLTDIDVLIPYCVAHSARLVCLCLLDPNEGQFSSEDLQQIHKFNQAGNSLIVAASCYESTSSKDKTNINRLTAKFGIKFNKDCVIRPNPYEQYHPKEARLSEFVANKGLLDSLSKFTKLGTNFEDASSTSKSELEINGPHILYANGCTLSVSNTLSTIMMTSSNLALPANQAICAFHRQKARGRVISIGSSSLFADSYIDKEDNKALVCAFLDFITNEKFTINISDAKTIEIPQVNATPDMDKLADLQIPCLRVAEPLPDRQNMEGLIDRRLFNIDNSLLPTIIRAYRELGVCHEPLTLIRPTFQVEPLKLKLATHNFLIRRQRQRDN